MQHNKTIHAPINKNTVSQHTHNKTKFRFVRLYDIWPGSLLILTDHMGLHTLHHNGISTLVNVSYLQLLPMDDKQ